MAEYVKKEDVLALAENADVNESFDEEIIFAYDVRELSPAADVVEVVRCKDCEHFSLLFDKRPLCLAGRAWMPIAENDFCAWGKKRTTDD